MKIKLPGLNCAAGLFASTLVKRWMSTLDCKAAFYDRTTDPTHPGFDGPKLYVFWHEYILLPLYLRGGCHCSMLLSQHRDADIMAHVAHFTGFDCVRGSTTRGGTAAIKELMKLSRTQNLTMTPDGPQGPRRKMSNGPIFLASKLQMPLVVLGHGYDQPWRFNSWDRFALPRPYSRARMIMGPQIRLPENLDRDGLEHYRVEMERLMNRLCSEAEAWAESGTAKVGEVNMIREPMRRPMPVRELPQRQARDRSATRTPAAPQTIPAPHHAPALPDISRKVA